jgi:FixJ family two-component response regulator
MRPEATIPDTGIGEGNLLGRPRVLLVDDDPAVRGSLKFALELEGFEVSDFASAELAGGAGAGDANCLVLDYRLPGMNGLQLLSLLRSRGSKAQAIIITSHPNRKIRDQIAAAHATLIEKPLLCDALTGAIRDLAERPAPGA